MRRCSINFRNSSQDILSSLPMTLRRTESDAVRIPFLKSLRSFVVSISLEKVSIMRCVTFLKRISGFVRTICLTYV